MQGTRFNSSSVFLVIDVEVAKTTTIFLPFWNTCLHSDPSTCRCSAHIARVLGLIFILLYYLDGIDPSGWMISPITALVFLESLGLRLISGREIMGLSLIFLSLIPVFLSGFVFVLLN